MSIKTLIYTLLFLFLTLIGVWTDFETKTRDDVRSVSKIIGFNWRHVGREELVAKLGLPEKIIKKEEGKSRWVYPYKNAWKGIYLVAVVIPIPLKFPSGKLNFYVDIDNEYIDNISYEYLSGQLYACGILFYFMTGQTEGNDPVFCGEMK